MKTIRVPWIACRADESGALSCEMQWRNHSFIILAYTEKEANDWWRGLSEREREDVLGIGSDPMNDSPGLF